MKNSILILLYLTLFVSCNQNQEDKGNQKQSKTYRPGLGEFMNNIQLHHAKLWFAAKNENWKLAQYEIDEIKENFELIREFETNRPETPFINTIYPSLDLINNSISKKDFVDFEKSFIILTNSCNSCHQATKFEFNVVTIPTSLPVVNQEFKPNY